jgi:hypothetical protein
MPVTKQDKREFRGYCEQCTDSQLRNVYAKETLARRTGYANIAREVMSERNLNQGEMK